MQRGSFLVTGGAGFIGSNLAATLALAGERVRAYDNLFTGHWALLDRLLGGRAEVERVTADIRDGEALAKAMEGVEVVFHEAADGSVPRSVADPIACDSINVHGTVRVLEAARRAGVRRLVFAASSAAYGDEPTLPKRESMSVSPLSPYAVSKVAGEQYLRAYAGLYGIETVSLRYFNVFGPNQLPNGAYAAAIPRFAHAAITGEAPTVYGDGEQTRDFCFIDNVVAANLAAASSSRKFSGEVINIAGGRVVSLNGVIAELGRLLGRPIAARYEAPRAGDIRHSYADISLAQELLGYRPQTGWEGGLAPTVAFLRELVERGLPGLARQA